MGVVWCGHVPDLYGRRSWLDFDLVGGWFRHERGNAVYTSKKMMTQYIRCTEKMSCGIFMSQQPARILSCSTGFSNWLQDVHDLGFSLRFCCFQPLFEWFYVLRLSIGKLQARIFFLLVVRQGMTCFPVESQVGSWVCGAEKEDSDKGIFGDLLFCHSRSQKPPIKSRISMNILELLSNCSVVV